MAQFSYYPDIDDPDFTQIIYRKKEFYDTKTDPDIYDILDDKKTRQRYLRERCDPDFFKLQNYQIFVRNYLSPPTPYRGLLLFHGVGTGKTCAAIQIAEGFKEDVNKLGQKIIVIAPDVLQDNFQKNLYDFKKEQDGLTDLVPGQNQCTGQTYYISPNVEPTLEIRKKMVENQQSQYYEYYTYDGYYKYYLSLFGVNEPSESDIRTHFDNTLYIIDEAHTMVEDPAKLKSKTPSPKQKSADESDDEERSEISSEDNEGREVKEERATAGRLYTILLNKILKFSKNVRIVLLSATPMRNQPKDLILLLDLLRMNDHKKESALIDFKRFQKEKIDIDNPIDPAKMYDEQYFKAMATGYISYVRGENPLTYAEKQFATTLSYVPRPLFDYYQKIILMYRDYLNEDVHRQPFYENYRALIPTQNGKNPTDLMPPTQIRLVECPMSIYQYYYYLKQESSTISAVTHSKQGGNVTYPLMYLSLIVYPDAETPDFDDQGYARNTKIKGQAINLSSQPKLTPSNTFKLTNARWDYINRTMKRDPILKDSRLAYYSSKLNSLLTILTDPDAHGLHYIYTFYVGYSAIFIAVMLEQNGFKRYGGDPLSVYQGTARCYCGRLKTQHKQLDHKFKQATYLLFASKYKPKQADLDAFNRADNAQGQIIKAVIGTRKASVGIDYKRIQHMHIMDPWHNATEIDQTIGRALRHCAHADLPPEQQVVTIYHYSAVSPKLEDWEKAKQDPYWEPKIMEIKERFNQLIRAKKDAFGSLITSVDQLPMRETNDERMYRRSYVKDRNIKYVERLVKQVAVDCHFNLNYNIFPTDRDQTRESDYLSSTFKCEYGVEKTVYELDELDLDTFKSHIYFIEPILREFRANIMMLYRKNFALDLDLLKQLITQNFNYSFQLNERLTEQYLYLALNQMLGGTNQKPIVLLDKYNRRGYLIYRHPYYVFQPEYIIDTRLPIYYRAKLPVERPPKLLDMMRQIDVKREDKQVDVWTEEKFKLYLNRWGNLLNRSLDNFNEKMDIIMELDKLSSLDHKYLLETSVEYLFKDELSATQKSALNLLIKNFKDNLLLIENQNIYIHALNQKYLTMYDKARGQWIEVSNVANIAGLLRQIKDQISSHIITRKTFNDLLTKDRIDQTQINNKKRNFSLPSLIGLLGTTETGAPSADKATLFKILDKGSEKDKTRDNSDKKSNQFRVTSIVCSTINKPEKRLGIAQRLNISDTQFDKLSKDEQCKLIETRTRKLNRESDDKFYFLNQYQAPFKRPAGSKTEEDNDKLVFERIKNNLFIKYLIDFLKNEV